MKKILSIVIVVLSILLIYLGFKDDKVYYLSLGDGISLGVTPYGGIDYGYSDYVNDYLKEKDLSEIYVNNFSKQNYRTTDLINDINDNVSVLINNKEKTIQNALIKADLITLSIGYNDLIKNLELSNDFGLSDLSNRFDDYILDLNELFELMRKYSKETIIFTNFYNPNNNLELKPLFANLNNQIKELCNKYDIQYIDVYSLFLDKNYIINQNSFYPSKEGYKVISDTIIDTIEPIFVKK